MSSTMSSTHSDGSPGGHAGSPAEESIQSSPAHCVAAGRGLQTAVIQQLSQFVITAYDEFGHHCQRGGEPFAIFVHGVKPPCKLRSKLVDHGDGHYTGEYKAEVSVARQPFSFDLDFVDALGHPAVAEELDLRVEPLVPLQVTASDAEEAARMPCSDDELAAAAAAFEQRMNAQGSLQLCLRRAMGLVGVDMNGKSDPYAVIELVNPHEIVKSKPKTKFTSTIKAKTLNPVWNETFELNGTLTELVGRELLIRVFDCDNPTRPEKDDVLGETSISLDFLRSINSREFTSDLTMKGKVVLEVIWMSPEIEISVDAKFVRGDDRVIIGNNNLILRQGFSKTSTELLAVPPETWVQLHEVSYSVGKAGKYLLHVGLRGQSAILPGSPFMLEVVPGPAHAPSTSIPADELPLRTVVGTTGRLVLVVNDNMGNPCNTRSVEKHAISMEVRVSSTEVKATCDDRQDGTMVVTWTGEKAGSYLMDILIDGEHVVGSPATIEMCPAEIEVGRCEVVAPREAVCGQPLKLELHLRDPYGNHVLTDEFIQDETSGRVCGIVLLPSVPKADGKKAVNKASKAEIEERLTLTPSVAFKGEWRASTFHMSYVPTEAGECEMHVWMDLDRSGQRTYLPGSPFPIRVQTGRPSASGSVVADVNLVSLGERLVFPAGDRLQIKVQLRDEFGNPVGLEGLNAGTLEGPLRATLQNQNGKQPLTLKQAGSTKDMALGLGDASTQGEKKGESKKKGDTKTEVRIGVYELVSQSELLVKGTHVAHILLNGSPIGGSPIEFTVTHSNAVAQKSFLECSTKAPTINWPCEVLLHLVDRYGNACERGDVRVEAKVFGSKASDVETTNRGDGIYTLTFTTYVPGDYKVSAKGGGGKKGGVGAKKGGKAKAEGVDAERAAVAKTPKGSAKKDDAERAAVAKTPKSSAKKDDAERAAVAKTPKGSAKRDDAERAAVAKTPKGSAKKDKGDPSAKPEPASAAAAGAAGKSKSATAHKVKKEKNGAQFTQELSQNYPGQEPLGLGAIMSAGGGTSGGGTAAADSAASEPPAIPPTAADQSFAAALAAEYVRQREYLEKTSELAALRERLAMVEASEQLKTDRATADLRAKVLARGF
ncbi:protein snt-2 [Chrysochromulina tobinii]|uniref:Protein snt-2 n=1 Tax=Chrysochromulina tobinii TaxID=1460289 RepID=A0A0M0K8Q6_9EUKA|nr:protein snt-2 [Chrysochromulina tobinii]|eukprot:KOO34783.1 protein snt-2 [Chrysochromulina sp. CCMP291]